MFQMASTPNFLRYGNQSSKIWHCLWIYFKFVPIERFGCNCKQMVQDTDCPRNCRLIGMSETFKKMANKGKVEVCLET